MIRDFFSLAGAPTNGVNEEQTVSITGSPTGGTFTLTFEGQTTAPIAYNATPAVVQAALEALSNVEVGDVVCTGTALPGGTVTVEFVRNLGGLNRTQMSKDATGLTGGVAPDVSIATTVGGVRGSFRGAENGSFLQDTTNGNLYQNSGTAWEPIWSNAPVL